MIDPGFLRVVSLVAILVFCVGLLLLTWRLCVVAARADQ